MRPDHLEVGLEEDINTARGVTLAGYYLMDINTR